MQETIRSRVVLWSVLLLLGVAASVAAAPEVPAGLDVPSAAVDLQEIVGGFGLFSSETCALSLLGFAVGAVIGGAFGASVVLTGGLTVIAIGMVAPIVAVAAC